METAAMLGSSAVSKATQVASSKVPNLGSIGKCMLQLENSMTETVAVLPQRMRNVIKMCMGEMGSKEEVVTTVSEIKAENKALKLPSFPLLNLYEFICCGPLLEKVGFTQEKVAQRIDEWLMLGIKLSRQLRFDEFYLSHSEMIGISAPLGCGKTTIVYSLE